LGGVNVVTKVLEVERKYDVDGELTPPLDGLPGVSAVDGPHRHTLDAAYYDTADLRLIRSGVTLRQRSGGDDAGWHLKLPAGGVGERIELRLPPDGDSTVPSELVDLTLARTRGAPLAPVARLRTDRTTWRLLDGGTAVAEVVTDNVHGETRSGSATSWHEVEVELLAGERDLLDVVQDRLLELGARPAASPSKVSRVLGDSLPDGSPAGSTPDGSAGAVVLAYLADQVEAILANDPKARRDEPDAVHQLRVAARRARSALQAFRPVLDRDRTEPIADELRWLGTVLAGPRDAEVQRARLLGKLRALDAELLVGPVISRVDSHLFGEHARAHEAMLEQLRGQRYLDLLDQLQRLLDDPPLAARAAKPAAAVLPAIAGKTQRRVRRAVTRYRQGGPDADDALHAIRKAAKRARYTADAMAPALGKPARRSAKRLKAVQGLLGDHQDTVVSRGLLRQLAMAAHGAGENEFSYGVLHGRDTAEAQRLRAELPDAWRRADRGKVRRWMG
jgi:CHAD domain-containing protein